MHSDSVLNVKAVVAAFNQEKTLQGAFSVIITSNFAKVCSSWCTTTAGVTDTDTATVPGLVPEQESQVPQE